MIRQSPRSIKTVLSAELLLFLFLQMALIKIAISSQVLLFRTLDPTFYGGSTVPASEVRTTTMRLLLLFTEKWGGFQWYGIHTRVSQNSASFCVYF
jgi:hypothetical protein